MASVSADPTENDPLHSSRTVSFISPPCSICHSLGCSALLRDMVPILHVCQILTSDFSESVPGPLAKEEATCILESGEVSQVTLVPAVRGSSSYGWITVRGCHGVSVLGIRFRWWRSGGLVTGSIGEVRRRRIVLLVGGVVRCRTAWSVSRLLGSRVRDLTFRTSGVRYPPSLQSTVSET